MAKVNDMNDDELVSLYVQIRDTANAEFKAAEERKAALKLKRDQIAAIIFKRFAERGIESMRTTHGTAFKKKVTSATVADKDVFLANVKATDAFELMDVRANKTGVEQYIAAHGDIPPGVNWREEIVIQVNRS